MALGIGATIGAAAFSGAADYFSAKSLQGDAQSFTRSMMRNKHQWQVEDLKKAGLNPILSAGGGAPMGGSGIASAGSPGTSAINSALSLRRQNQELLNMAETEGKTVDERRILGEEYETAHAEAERAKLILKYYRENPNRIGEEIKANIAGKINSAYSATLAAGLTIDDFISTPDKPKTPKKPKNKGKKYNPIEGWHD